MRLLLFFLFLLTLLYCSWGAKNLNVTKIIDLKSAVVRVEYDIIAENVNNGYEFSIPSSELIHLSHISASKGKKKEALNVISVEGKPGVYMVDIKLQGTVQLGVSVILTGILEPKPPAILQNEKQFLKYTGSATFFSSYFTGHQVTHILLPNGELLRYSPAPEPISKQSKKLIYGPYYDIAPKTETPIHVHFEYDKPVIAIKKLVRHIEISHWGNIAVEDSIEIRNVGAKLRGPFSRLDFDMGQGKQTALTSFKTALPGAAKHIYYRDEIGNVSTSSVVELLDSMEVRLSPRFPLMGGWKTEYILGYNVPAHQFLYRDGSQFSLQMRFVDHIYDDQHVEDVTVRIVLPELVSDIQFVAPYPVSEEPREVLKTYLDTVGRTVLVFTAKNLATEHIMDFTLKYRFNMLMMLREPLMLVTAFCAIVAFVLIYVRSDFSIYRDEKAELRLLVQSTVDEAQNLFQRRASTYQSYEDMVHRYKSNKDVSQLTFERRKLELEHKSTNQSLLLVQQKMTELYTDGAERLKELASMDANYRDLVQESIQLAERVLSGKITKQQYQSSDSDLSGKKAELINRMEAIIDNL